MQDPLEIRLARLPLRQVPAHWRGSILNRVGDVRIRKKPSVNILAFAAAWLLIGVLQWSAHESGGQTSGQRSGPVYLPVLSFVRSAEAYLEELLADPEAAPIGPRQSSLIQKPIAARV